MQELLAALAGSDIATAVRMSRWGYAAVNTTHVLGIALLVGGILPLDLRLLGWRREVAASVPARFLVPTAAAGLALAVLSGFLLFAARAPEYAALSVFQFKLALIALGTLGALALHGISGLWLQRRPPPRLFGLLSLACWLGALVCGRLIGFLMA